MLFPVNRETRKLTAVIRDLLFLIAVNWAQAPPPPLTAPHSPMDFLHTFTVILPLVT